MADDGEKYVETQPLLGPPAPGEHAHGFPAAEEGDKAIADMEEVVSNALRYGVLTSFVILLLGSIWLFLRGHTGYADMNTIGKGALKTLTAYHAKGSSGPFLRTPTTPGETLRGVLLGKPYAVISLGLLLLIATPVLRVAVSVFTFLWEGDRLYAVITTYVLLILIVSFLIGKGG